jgi:hypothetical protein
MMNRSKFRAAAGLLFVAAALRAGAPAGWQLAGGNPKNYETGLDSKVTIAGQPSAYLRSTGAAPEAKQNFGTLMQGFEVTQQYAGRRVRFSAFVKSDSVAGWSGLWMRVDGKDKPGLSFDNMQNRVIQGTSDWRRYEVVLDVPEDATAIAFGILLSKSGTVWMSGVTFEVVGANVPVTNMVGALPAAGPPPTTPQNLNFEK